MIENLLNINKIIDNIIKRNNILNNCLVDFIDLLIFNIFKLIEGKNNKEKNKNDLFELNENIIYDVIYLLKLLKNY